MVYDFRSREREFGLVVFALTLDRKRMTERIVIGRYDDVRLRLGSYGADVYYDELRPLGSLLFSFEGDKDFSWNRNGMALRESYSKAFPFESGRWEMAAPVSDFLSGKYESGEPSTMFAAIRTWEDYLNCFNTRDSADALTGKLSMLYRPFFIYADCKPWREAATDALSSALRDGDSSVELWYPVAKRPFETVVAASSFLPLIAYYLNRIGEWRLVFQECKVCGKDFLARSRHFELCSGKCRKAQAVVAKREHDERARGDRLEQLDKASYYYWDNRLRKLKKAANQDAVASFKAALGDFRKEAVRRKREVRSGEMPESDFTGWLVRQQDEADRLMEELSSKLS